MADIVEIKKEGTTVYPVTHHSAVIRGEEAFNPIYLNDGYVRPTPGDCVFRKIDGFVEMSILIARNKEAAPGVGIPHFGTLPEGYKPSKPVYGLVYNNITKAVGRATIKVDGAMVVEPWEIVPYSENEPELYNALIIFPPFGV